MNINSKTSVEAFPIRTVSALTGINPITLRTWERRYHLIEPVRTPKGHRLYTKEHITMLHRVVALLDRGVPISRINHSLISESNNSPSSAEEEFWNKLIDRMLAAVARFDELTVENTYNEALSLYHVETVTQKLLIPLLSSLGERWESGMGTVAEEHFFGVYLRNKLGARFHHRKRRESGPVLLTACMPGERHESGLLLFALSAYEHGYRCILLGADMPIEELPAAVKQAKADGIVLSASFTSNPELLRESLKNLTSQVNVPVFIGGYSSFKFAEDIQDAGAIPLGTDIDFSFHHLAENLERRQSDKQASTV